MDNLVKICGLSTPETLDVALAAGADMVGFVRFPKSPRHVSLDLGHRLSLQARGRARRVVLLVNPDEAERLTLASTEGKIQLALRNPLDRENPSTNGVKPAALLGTPPPIRKVSTRVAPTLAAAAVPAPAAAPVVQEPPTVEIIRGDKRAREVVREQE